MSQQKTPRRAFTMIGEVISERADGAPDPCGMGVTCVCELQLRHQPKCRFLLASQLSVELACEHGFQACPTCDPCTCGTGATEGVR